jgi:acyl carrier protein
MLTKSSTPKWRGGAEPPAPRVAEAPVMRDNGRPMNREELKRNLKNLLIDGLRLQDVRPEDIQDGAPIFVEGLGLDSVDALELVVLVEERFNIQIPDEDVGKQAFASIDALTEYVSTELGKGS